MSSLKLNLGKCLPLWQSNFGYTYFHRLIYSSAARAEAEGTDRDTFGRLAALSREAGSLNTDRDKRKRYKQFPKLQHTRVVKLNSERRGAQQADDPQSYPEAVLEKWNKFIDVDKKEILKSSSLIQDDSKDDFHFLIQRDHKIDGRANHKEPRTTPIGELHTSSPSCTTERDSRIYSQTSKPDKFGTISPHKVEYETMEGDEGDRREERFEEARQRRKHRPRYYAQRMIILCRERKLSEALHIMEVEMPEVRAKPDEFCYNVLINACGHVGYTKKAFQLYNQMKKRGLKVQDVVYTGLFSACANSPWPTTDGLQRATLLRSQLIEKGYPVNKLTSHAIIKAFGRCGDMKTAFQIVDEMVSSNLLVTTETLNFLLQACITDTTSGFRHAVWKKMRELNLSPDIYSYNLLIRCTADCLAGDPHLTSELLLPPPPPQQYPHTAKHRNKDTRKTFQTKILTVEAKNKSSDMENLETTNRIEDAANRSGEISLTSQASRESLLPDEKRYIEVEVPRKARGSEGSRQRLPNILGRTVTTGAVVGLGSLDQPQDRLALLGGLAGVLEQMMADGVKPDLKTVTQLVTSLPSDTQSEEALLSSMKNIDLEPDTQFCNMLIRKRNFRGETKAAKDVLEIIQDYHLMPDIITFGCLALGCHHFHDATQFLADMDMAQFRPNLEIMDTLIKNGLEKGNYFFTLEMLQEMKRRGIQPDKRLLGQLERGRARARRLLLKREGQECRDKRREQKMEGARIFLMEYKNWLKLSQVELPDHPWAQYKQQPEAQVSQSMAGQTLTS